MNTLHTKDYSIFKHIAENRPVRGSHVKKLIKSIQATNLLESNPIIVNAQMEVIDGQHRLEACKKLDIPVYYVVRKQSGIAEVRQLNDNVKGWTIADFARSYADSGKEDYIQLIEYTESFGIPLGLSATLLAGLPISDGGGDGQVKIRDGSFKIKSEKKAYKIANYLQEIMPYTEGSVWRNRVFIRALMQFYAKDRVTHDTFVTQLERHPDKLCSQKDYREYMLAMQDVYNHRRKQNERIDIFA